MSALLQFEFDRECTNKMYSHEIGITRSEKWFRYEVIRHALEDTMRNGGTFVLVASEKTITVVQRAEADSAFDVQEGK